MHLDAPSAESALKAGAIELFFLWLRVALGYSVPPTISGVVNP